MPEFPAPDPRQLWQNQSTEPFRMSTQQLRLKAAERESRSRTEALASIVLGFVMAGAFAWAAFRAHDLTTRLGWGLLSFSGLYFARQVHKWLWPGRLASDATPVETVRYYRTLLEKRRDFERHAWRRSGIPLAFLGIAIVLAPPLIRSPQLVPKAAPFFVLLAVWLAVLFPMRRRRQRALQREIDELRGFDANDLR